MIVSGDNPVSLQDQRYDIFVSYARSDRPRVLPLIAALEASGWRVFWDHDIPPGWTWDEYIGARLEEATVVVVVWSKESFGSEFVRTEASRARRRRALIPVRIDHIDPPVEFERVHAADLIAWAAAPQPSLPEALHLELKRRLSAAEVRAQPMPGSTSSGEPVLSTKAPAGQPGRVSPDRPADPPSSAALHVPADEGARKIGWRAIGIVAVVGALFGAPVVLLSSLLSGGLLAGIACITRTYGTLTALIAIAAADAAMAMALSAAGVTGAGSLFYVLNFTAGHAACVVTVRIMPGSSSWRAAAIAVAVGALVGALVSAVLLGALFGKPSSLTMIAVNFAVELVAGILCMVVLLALFRQRSRPQAAG
jgi:hypothetical protein